MDHVLYVGSDADGNHYALRVYDDGTHRIAVRTDDHAYGPEVELTAEPVEVPC